MLPTRHLIEFALTVYVLILIPGPSVSIGARSDAVFRTPKLLGP